MFLNPKTELAILAVILWTTCLFAAGPVLPWGQKSRFSYHCAAIDKKVFFEVRFPLEVAGLDRYPLLVVLKNGPRVESNREIPLIQVKPNVRGIWGYRSMSAHDVKQVLDYALTHFPVDEERVYLAGFSAGASGAMHVASACPDRFAAVLPMVAAGNNYPLVNFRNLPVAMHHGNIDWTSSICNARVQFQRMKELDCPVLLKEYRGTGHTVPQPHKLLIEWLLLHKRNPYPKSISHRCETPESGKNHWLSIGEFDDPHELAEIDARWEKGTVFVKTTNVSEFSVNLEQLGEVSLLKVDSSSIPVGRAGIGFFYRSKNRDWVQVDEPSRGPERIPYRCGAAANLYQGEPMMIVYGDTLEKTAMRLAACGGPRFGRMKQPFPTIFHTEASDLTEKQCHLLLLGTPEQNNYTKSIVSKLPFRIDNGRLLIAGDRPPLPLNNRVLSVVYPNPKNPSRLIYMIAAYPDTDNLSKLTANPEFFLSGSDGFGRGSAADLLVQTFDCKISRQMQFGKNWEWRNYPGVENRIRPNLSDRSQIARLYLEVMKEKSAAHFGMWWGPADRGRWGTDFNFLRSYDAQFATEADFRTQRRNIETMTGWVSGSELIEIWNRWGGAREELIFHPEIDRDRIEASGQYQIVIPMDLYIKLGQRRKNLGNPEAGPNVSPRDILTRIGSDATQ